MTADQPATGRVAIVTGGSRGIGRETVGRLAADGFSLVDQEAEIGFRSISVPLRRLDGRVVAALNVGVRSERCALATMRGVFLPKLRTLADGLQRQLV